MTLQIANLHPLTRMYCNLAYSVNSYTSTPKSPFPALAPCNPPKSQTSVKIYTFSPLTAQSVFYPHAEVPLESTNRHFSPLPPKHAPIDGIYRWVLYAIEDKKAGANFTPRQP